MICDHFVVGNEGKNQNLNGYHVISCLFLYYHLAECYVPI